MEPRPGRLRRSLWRPESSLRSHDDSPPDRGGMDNRIAPSTPREGRGYDSVNVSTEASSRSDEPRRNKPSGETVEAGRSLLPTRGAVGSPIPGILFHLTPEGSKRPGARGSRPCDPRGITRSRARERADPHPASCAATCEDVRAMRRGFRRGDPGVRSRR